MTHCIFATPHLELSILPGWFLGGAVSSWINDWAVEGSDAFARYLFSVLQTNLNSLLLPLHNTYPVHQIQFHNAVSSLLYRSSGH
jgi:hypothetical protein